MRRLSPRRWHSQLHSTQPKFISRHDSRAEAAAGRTYQAVRLGWRLRATCHATNCDRRGLDRQSSFCRTTAGTQRRKCTGEERGLDARERTHFDGDSLDQAGAAAGSDCGDLRQQGLADGQLVHSAERSLLRDSLMYVRAQTTQSRACSDSKILNGMRGDVSAGMT